MDSSRQDSSNGNQLNRVAVYARQASALGIYALMDVTTDFLDEAPADTSNHGLEQYSLGQWWPRRQSRERSRFGRGHCDGAPLLRPVPHSLGTAAYEVAQANFKAREVLPWREE